MLPVPVLQLPGNKEAFFLVYIPTNILPSSCQLNLFSWTQGMKCKMETMDANLMILRQIFVKLANIQQAFMWYLLLNLNCVEGKHNPCSRISVSFSMLIQFSPENIAKSTYEVLHMLTAPQNVDLPSTYFSHFEGLIAAFFLLNPSCRY